MNFEGRIHSFPLYVKHFVAVFIVVLSVGYYTGLLFVGQTNTHNPKGIEENYLGNEEEEAVDIMKFKKGEREMLTIIHTHVLSMSFIFFMLGGLVALTSLPKKWKAFLMIEPFLSVVLTFGGIYLLWSGVLWMKWIVMASGIVMTAVFILTTSLVLIQLYKKK